VVLMKQKERVYQLLSKRNGTVARKEALNSNVNPNTLQRMLTDDEIYSPIKGIFVQKDKLEDTYYSRQKIFKKGIYSLETALVLHDLTDLIPKEYIMTFPRGYNNPNLGKYFIKGVYKNKELYQLGVEWLKTPHGNPIRVYNLERTLCDVWDPKNKVDFSIRMQATKSYLKHPKRKQYLLPAYLNKLNLKTELIQTLEMLQ